MLTCIFNETPFINEIFLFRIFYLFFFFFDFFEITYQTNINCDELKAVVNTKDKKV